MDRRVLPMTEFKKSTTSEQAISTVKQWWNFKWYFSSWNSFSKIYFGNAGKNYIVVCLNSAFGKRPKTSVQFFVNYHEY